MYTSGAQTMIMFPVAPLGRHCSCFPVQQIMICLNLAAASDLWQRGMPTLKPVAQDSAPRPVQHLNPTTRF